MIKMMQKGWISVKLSELFLDPKNNIVDGPFGSDLKSSDFVNSGIPIIKIQNIDRNRFIDKNITFISSEKADFLSRHNFKVGDIVLTKLGDPLGKACIVPPKYGYGVIVADLVRIRVDNKHVHDRFLLHQINSGFLIEQFNKFTKGTTRPRIKLSTVRELTFVLAPYEEQVAIVTIIDELFAKLDNCVMLLQSAQNLLKIYRLSLQKYAFEGKLTADWRKVNKPESATYLLNKIKADRITQYQSNIENWQIQQDIWQNNKTGKKPIKPKIQSNRDSADVVNYPKLPSSWTVAQLGELVIDQNRDITDGPFGSNMKSSDYIESGVPVIKIQNIDRNKFVDKKISYVSEEKAFELKKHGFIAGDIVLTKLGEPLGKACVIPSTFPFGIIVADLIRIRLTHSYIDKRFLLNLLNSPNVIAQFEKITKGTTRQRVNLTLVRDLLMSVPSLEEQKEITKILDERELQTGKLENTIFECLKNAEVLRQSILKMAFEGKLVKNIQNKTTASKILNQIKIEREQFLASQKSNKKQIAIKNIYMEKELSIEEVLREAGQPQLAKDVWQKSKHKHNIEEFYAELKKIQDNIKEIKKGTDSLLSLIS